MNYLPDEILLHIIDQLDIQTMVTCRLVCRRFRFWIDQTALEQLVFDNMPKRKPLYWFHTDRAIAAEAVLRNFNLKRILEIPFRLDRLRCLYLNCHLRTDEHRDTNSINYLKLCTLNEFVRLEYLAIQTMQIVYEEILSLPALKALDIFEITKPDTSQAPGIYTFTVSNLVLDAPHLTLINCEFGLQHLLVLHAESVRELSVGDRQTALGAYTGCEVFRCDWPGAIHKDLLEQLPALKRLHLNEDDSELFDYEETRRTLDGLMGQKRRLARNELNVYFLDSLLDENKRFDDYRFDTIYENVFS